MRSPLLFTALAALGIAACSQSDSTDDLVVEGNQHDGGDSNAASPDSGNGGKAGAAGTGAAGGHAGTGAGGTDAGAAGHSGHSAGAGGTGAGAAGYSGHGGSSGGAAGSGGSHGGTGGFAGNCAAGAPQAPIAAIDLENASLSPCTPPADTSAHCTGSLSDSGHGFTLFEQGAFHEHPWISPTLCWQGAHSLGFDASSTAVQQVPDRSELVLSDHTDSDGVKFGVRRYVRFQVYVDPASQPPDPASWLLFHQVWQYSTDSTAKANPPFAIFVKPQADANGPIVLEFKAKNNPTVYGYPAGPFYTQELSKGKWHEVIVQLQPGHEDDGQIAVWIDRLVCWPPNAVWKGNWGYTGGGHQNQFNVRVGVYRNYQPRRFKVFFDQIKFGGSGASITP